MCHLTAQRAAVWAGNVENYIALFKKQAQLWRANESKILWNRKFTIFPICMWTFWKQLVIVVVVFSQMPRFFRFIWQALQAAEDSGDWISSISCLSSSSLAKVGEKSSSSFTTFILCNAKEFGHWSIHSRSMENQMRNIGTLHPWNWAYLFNTMASICLSSWAEKHWRALWKSRYAKL